MSEHEPMFRIPSASGAMLLLLIAIYALQIITGFDITDYSVQPHQFWEDPLSLHHLLTLITYQFLHANLLHLGVNGLMLLAFGSAMARIVGSARFILLYLFCGIIAAVAHLFAYADQTSYLVGASGAVSGAMGFVLWGIIQHPRKRLQLILAILILQPVLAFASGTLFGGEIAWLAHVAGFAAGIGMALAFKFK
ncbi:MAG TPA: rhomboid family intramembrane serine protease [Alphaproteobacteria bacterium]|nr:hypothetical protein [Rhodospirillaceae bacterium]HRJ12578.1 rhomboid family intramembrane serine protease [Alphaproteobacteria bacterium]